jgi:hypothetical protein
MVGVDLYLARQPTDISFLLLFCFLSSCSISSIFYSNEPHLQIVWVRGLFPFGGFCWIIFTRCRPCPRLFERSLLSPHRLSRAASSSSFAQAVITFKSLFVDLLTFCTSHDMGLSCTFPSLDFFTFSPFPARLVPLSPSYHPPFPASFPPLLFF